MKRKKNLHDRKAKIVTSLFSIMLFSILWTICQINPAMTNWVLGIFAIPGACKFIRVLYIWVKTEPQEEEELW